MRMSELVIVV